MQISNVQTISDFEQGCTTEAAREVHVVSTRRISNGKRSVVIHRNLWDRRQSKRRARLLQTKLNWQIHPNVFGFVRGRGLHKLLLKQLLWRKNGLHILRLDIRRAYRNTDLKRLEKLLSRSRIRGPLNYEFVDRNFERIRINGLAEGLHDSPIFLAVVMSPVMKRINKKFPAAVYGDDIFVALKSEDEKDAALVCVKQALSKNQYKGRIMQIHNLGAKGFQLYGPHSAFQFGGVEFSDGVGILPQPGKSALHYIRTLAQIYHSPLMGNSLKELKNWIENNCPASYLRRSDEEWATAYLNPIAHKSSDSADLGDEGRSSEKPDSAAPFESEHRSSTYSSPSYSSNTVGMESQRTNGAADFGSFTGCVAFSGLTDITKSRIFFRLNSDAKLLNDLYKRQREASTPFTKKDIRGRTQILRHPYWDFVEELNARFISFSLNSADCLTSAIRPTDHPLANPYNREVRRMYREELETINNDLPDMLKESVSKKYRQSLEIKAPKIRQFLRGYCHLRMIDVCFGRLPHITPALAKSLGILAFPLWEVSYMKTAIDCWTLQVLTTEQFQRVIQSMANRMKNGNVVPINGIVAEITALDPQYIDRLLWNFRSNGGQHGNL